MRRQFCCLLLTTLAVVAPAAADWSEHTRAGEWAFSRGDRDRAEREFKAALDEAQKMPQGDRRLEESLDNLARLYEHETRYAEAQPLYQLLVAAREARLGEQHRGLLEPLAAVARTSLRLGDAPTAEASLRRYVAIADATGAADPAELWQIESLLSRSLVLQDQGEEALLFQRRAVETMAKDTAVDPSSRAAELESLAQLELLHGDPSRAEGLLSRALDLRTEAGDAGSAGETLAAAAMTALGGGEPELAERLATRAVAAASTDEVRAKALAALSDAAWMRIGSSSARLGDIVGVGREDAEIDATRARLEDLEKVLQRIPDADPARQLTTVSRLAAVAAMAGDVEAAADWQRKVVALTPGNGLDARRDLVSLLQLVGRADDAAAENAAVIAAIESTMGEGASQLLEPLRLQQQLLTEAGRKAEAKKLKKRIRTLEKSLR